MRRPPQLDEAWRAAIKARDVAILARTITAIERSPEFLLQLSKVVFAVETINSIGITGVPGAGKSTLLNQLIAHYRAAGKQVAVLAVDPSSQQSGGAVLGDRLRMQDHALDSGVFVRSLSTKGQLGGVSETTFITAQLLKFAGFDRIFIETVGIGQNELDIVSVADVSALVFIPGGGDAVQGIKSGVMEIGDVFVINKCDLEGVRALEKILQQEAHEREIKHGYATAVHQTNAVSGEGVDQVVDSLEAALAMPQVRQRRGVQLQAFARLLLEIELREGWLKPFLESEAGITFFSGLERGEVQPDEVVEVFEKNLCLLANNLQSP